MTGPVGAALRLVGRVLVRAATAVSTMVVALDGRRPPPPPLDAEPEEYRP